jgi:hypothetical protein
VQSVSQIAVRRFHFEKRPHRVAHIVCRRTQADKIPPSARRAAHMWTARVLLDDPEA